MKISYLIFSVLFALTVNCTYAAVDASDDTVKTFAEIYQKLDSVQWGGKNIGVVIESLEHLSPDAHLAATDDRIIMVWRDSIVGNFQKPETVRRCHGNEHQTVQRKYPVHFVLCCPFDRTVLLSEPDQQQARSCSGRHP